MVFVVDVITTVADGITTIWLMELPCSSWNTNYDSLWLIFVIVVADGITTCLADVIANMLWQMELPLVWLMLLPIWQMV